MNKIQNAKCFQVNKILKIWTSTKKRRLEMKLYLVFSLSCIRFSYWIRSKHCIRTEILCVFWDVKVKTSKISSLKVRSTPKPLILNGCLQAHTFFCSYQKKIYIIVKKFKLEANLKICTPVKFPYIVGDLWNISFPSGHWNVKEEPWLFQKFSIALEYSMLRFFTHFPLPHLSWGGWMELGSKMTVQHLSFVKNPL